jgi:hypothetical protein
MGQVTAANANRDGTGTLVDIVTAGQMGTLIELIHVHAIVTTTAGMVRLFLYDGVNNRLYAEIPVAAVTPSASVAAFEAEYIPTKPLVLPTGWKLKAATEKAEAMNVVATGGDY